MVLIISQKMKNATTLSDVFYYMNILSYPCTPSEALNEISTLYNAVLISEPNDLPDAADFVRKLRSLAPVPVFAIANEPKKCKCPHVFDKVFTNAILSGNLAAKMLRYLQKNNLPLFGDYFRVGLDVRCTEAVPKYFLNEMNLTKTERMILCYLVAVNPTEQHPSEILKYAYPHNKKPEINCIRTHITKINDKFQKQMQFRLVRCIPRVGYYLADPGKVKREDVENSRIAVANKQYAVNN